MTLGLGKGLFRLWVFLTAIYMVCGIVITVTVYGNGHIQADEFVDVALNLILPPAILFALIRGAVWVRQGFRS
jgi:hypothetical protein